MRHFVIGPLFATTKACYQTNLMRLRVFAPDNSLLVRRDSLTASAFAEWLGKALSFRETDHVDRTLRHTVVVNRWATSNVNALDEVRRYGRPEVHSVSGIDADPNVDDLNPVTDTDVTCSRCSVD